MRLGIWLGMIASVSLAVAQEPTTHERSTVDPTMPSRTILERLRGDQPTASPSAREPSATGGLPKIRLKGLVLSNSNRGTAIIEVDQRLIRLRLERPAVNHSVAPETAIHQLQIGGKEYRVVDFSEHSITLYDGSRHFVVQ